MNKAASVVGAAGVGAGLMYLFDPDRGKRRRAKVRNKAMHIKRVASDYAGKTQRDVRNRISGVIAETEALFHSEIVSDYVLEAIVRSKLGRIVSLRGIDEQRQRVRRRRLIISPPKKPANNSNNYNYNNAAAAALPGAS